MKELTLEITNQCQNKCLHCSSNCVYDEGNIQELSLEQIKQLLDKYKPEIVNISGGEPFEHWQILDILNYLENNKIQHNLYTSLYPICTLYPDKVFKILNIFKTHKYLHIIMPLHSCNDTINDLFMGKEGVSDIVKGYIKILTTYESINCSIHIVPTTLNIHTIDDTIQYLINEGIKDVKILKLVVGKMRRIF